MLFTSKHLKETTKKPGFGNMKLGVLNVCSKTDFDKSGDPWSKEHLEGNHELGKLHES